MVTGNKDAATLVIPGVPSDENVLHDILIEDNEQVTCCCALDSRWDSRFFMLFLHLPGQGCAPRSKLVYKPQ